MFRRILRFLGQPEAKPRSLSTHAPIPAPGRTEALVGFELVEHDHDDGASRGFVLRRCSDGQFLSWMTLPKRDGLESINVVGEKYRIDAVQSAAFAPGSRVLLIPEPSNPVDPHALAVWSAERKLHAGYIPKEDAERIKRKLDRQPHDVFVVWETREGRQRTNIRLLLVRNGVELRAPNGRFLRD